MLRRINERSSPLTEDEKRFNDEALFVCPTFAKRLVEPNPASRETFVSCLMLAILFKINLI